MGVQDFEGLFDTVDQLQTGFVSAQQLHEFCEALYYSPVCIQHVEGAIKHVCQTPSLVTRPEFLDVLTDIERRRNIDDQAYWDFQALDYTGRNKISVHDALMLFKEIHGDAFSMSTWKRFLSSRDLPDADVFYDEIRFWLCSPPIGSPCTDKDIKEEENKLLSNQGEHHLMEYNALREALDDDSSVKAEKDDHAEEQSTHARRKLKKWNKQGLEAMLFDDGLDVDDTEVKVKAQGQVALSDLHDLLEVKYDALKEKLMQEMARQAAPVEEEVAEMYEQVRRYLKKMVKDGAKVADDVPAGHTQMLASLTGLMGELRLHDREHRRQMEELKVTMKEKGRSLREIALAVQQKYEEIIAGDTSCAGIMQQVHQRHRQEREALMATLKIDPGNSMTQAMLVEYVRLTRQITIMEEEPAFVSIATAVGLAERAMESRLDRSDWDRSRSERLAQLRIEQRIGKQRVQTPQDQPDIETLEKQEVLDLQVLVATEMTHKHFYEREALIHMLLGKECRDGLEKAKKLKADDRKGQMKTLQSQHKNWKSSPKADKAVLHSILQQALVLKLEDRRVELADGGLGKLGLEELREVILADLQQKQGTDFEGVLVDMQKLGKQQVIVLLGRQCGARFGEIYDNIASILLGTRELSEEDEDYMKALDHKYEILRKRIFLMALRDKMDWKNISKQEKQTALKEVGKQEKLYRSEGKLQEMASLLGPKAMILPALRSLIGEDKAEYQRRKHSQGQDEVPVEQTTVVNILADLIPRHDNEQDFLLSWLHSPEGKGFSLRLKRMRIVEIRVETARVEMEEDFEIATLASGLMERVKDTLTNRHERDMDRQSELSRRRVQQRRLRLQQHEEYRKEPEIAKDKVPSSGDITGLQVVYLREMLKRHTDEREVMLTHLQDESLDDLVELAADQSDDERQRRLIELMEKRQNLNLTLQDDKDEHVSILEEAAALRSVSVREELAAEGNSNNMEMVAVAMLAELQEEQDREIALTLNQVENMNEEDIRTSLSREINNRRLGNAWNVMTVFTRYQGEATDDLLMKALENKYTVLRQKLLVDALRIRMGTDQWQSLSQNEKQQKLMMIDSQAVEQLKIGKIMPSLLGEDFKLPETIAQLMGVCQHVFRNKVKGQQVTGNPSNLSMAEDPGVMSKTKDKPVNPLKILYQRLEDDRSALTRQLKGQSEDHFSECERLIQLTRYHREVLLTNQQESFVTVAVMVGLFERQQETVHFRLEQDVDRYTRLARKLIQDMDRGQHHSLPAEKPNTRSTVEFLDYLMGLLENKHVKERELLCRLLANTDKMADQKQQAMVSTAQERRSKMAELRDVRLKTLQERHMENLEVLTEGTVYKVVDRQEQLADDNDGDVADGILQQSLMASLLEYQNSEAERLIRALAVKSDEGLHQEEQKILQDTKSNMADNIALVVLSPDPTDGAAEDELIEALQGKYDALKDKLLAEALMKELGEQEWNRLSEKERQRKLFELKLKDRQLRKAGRVDEANLLISQLLQDQENLRQLMGDTTAEQRRRMEERLRRRKERLAQGMSEAEVDELERQEKLADDAEIGNTNILEDLQNRFDQERDELLRRIHEAGDETERERERQANLARLRRDQRLGQREDNFNSAALILGLTEQRDKDMRPKNEEERARQEKLARERLEAARERRAQGIHNTEDMNDPVTVDTDSELSLQEAIARDMDRRHQRERDMLVKLMHDTVNSPRRKAVQKMSDIERDDRLFELTEMHKNWTNADDKNLQEQLEILQDAITIMLELLKDRSLADGHDMSEEETQVQVLADLQQQQLAEAARLLQDIRRKDLHGLQQLHKALTTMKSEENYDNIATVLLGDQRSRSHADGEDEEGSGEETSKASLMKALEEKYDAMKDKLLIEALMQEMGEREWERLSEKQRQKKLIDLKLRERQLRRDGKLDEIANIIGAHLENEKLLDQFIVETEEDQRRRLEERVARRKQLIAEREAQGLPADEGTINEIIEKEEEEVLRQKRRNILEDLQKNFDDERAQLLRNLANQTDKASQERLRQIELAKLKRDERRMRKGEKLNDAAMMIHEARERDRQLEESITAERERQRNLARERLEARRRRKAGGQQTGTSEQLTTEEQRGQMEDAVRQAEGRSVHEALLVTMETKQEEEMDTLMGLLETARADQSARGIPDEELKLGLTKLENDEIRWRKRSQQAVDKMADDSKLTAKESEGHMNEVVRNRSDQLKILTEAANYRLEVERRLLAESQPELNKERVEEEAEVVMVTDLQEKQTAETRAVQKLMDQQDDNVLREMKRGLHVSTREGWYDNLVQTMFHLSHDEVGGEEEVEIDQRYEDSLAQIEQDIEQQTQDKIQKARALGEAVDEEAIRRQIMEQYEQTKLKLYNEKQGQKEALKQRLLARKMTKDQKNYEAYAARALIQQANDNISRIEQNVAQERGKQSNALQQKLAERRAARLEAKSLRDEMQREHTLDDQDDRTTRPPGSRGNSNESPLPPFGGMRREKTVVDVDVSDEQKQALLTQMVQQQRTLQSKISEQQRRQEEMLRRRLENRMGRQQEEAAEVFSLGQRQKTILEKTQQDERQRQIGKIRERVQGQREKREPSPGGAKLKSK